MLMRIEAYFLMLALFEAATHTEFFFSPIYIPKSNMVCKEIRNKI